MLIDPYTVAIQVVNFLLLVVLLRVFLYRPVVRVIDARRARIAEDLAAAHAARDEAEAWRRRREGLEHEFAEERRSASLAIERDAEQRRERSLEGVRGEVAERRAEMFAAWERERAAIGARLRLRFGEEVVDCARRILTELADADLESAMARRLAERLDEVDLGAFGAGPVAVRHGFPLADDARDRLAAMLASRLGRPVTFEHDPERGCGIEVVGGDARVSWSVGRHVDEVERRVFVELAAASGGEGTG